jgi:hypothetical protein
LTWALLASLALHGALVAALVIHQTPPVRTHELTDVVGDSPTVLSLRVAEPEVAEEQPEPAPAEPEPASDPAPEPAVTSEPEVTPEPTRASAELVLAAEPGPEPAEPAAGEPAPSVVTPRAVASVESPPPAPPPPSAVLFAGVQADPAATVVYVVDGSGPMASSLPFVFAELERSVRRLSPAQRFGVIVFRDPPEGAAGISAVERYQPSGRLGVVEATDLHKAGLSAWLRTIRPAGRSDPVRGLRAALELKPDLIMLLSRTIPRSGPGAEAGAQIRGILAELDRLNPASRITHQRPTVIKTIQFIDDDPSGLLQAIAAAHGDGPRSYRLVSLDDLNAR